MKDKRLWWVDWSKSICIFLMVVGHSFYPEKGSIDWMAKNLIYSFHMPLFFFVSGYLTKYKEDAFTKFLIKQVKSLLIPYLFFNLVCFIAFMPINKFNFDHERFIETIVGGGHSFAGATWFLLSLFWVKLFGYFINKGGPLLIVAVSIIMAISVYVCPKHIWFGLPAAILAFPIFSLGYLVKNSERLFSLLRNNKIWICFFSMALLLIVNMINESTAMFSLSLGRYPFLYYPEILIGLIMIVSFSLFFERLEYKIGSLFSSGSIVIMGTHGGITPYVIFALNAFGLYNIISTNTLLDALMVSTIVIVISIPVIIFFQKHLYMLIGNRKQ